MAQYLLLLSLSITLIFGASVANKPSAHIFGGSDTEAGEFSHHVSVQIRKSFGYIHNCGGSIIAPSWVITAAHCTQSRVSLYRIVAGITILNSTNPERQERNVVKLINHPKYNGTSYTIMYDVSLLNLDKALEFNRFVKAIQLPKPGLESEGKVITIGWGAVDKPESHAPNTLLKLTTTIIAPSICERRLHPPYLVKTLICTGSERFEGSCSGDSGGPLIQKSQIIGVVSFASFGCGNVTVYTKVSSYIDFIEKYVKNVQH